MADEIWQASTLVDQNRHMLKTGFMADCTFEVGKEGETEKFRAHKLQLSRASETLYKQFHDTETPAPLDAVIRVTDITPGAFKIMLKYIYTDHFKVTSMQSAAEVCQAALKYQIAPLTVKCMDYMKGNLSAEHVCTARHYALLCKNEDLQNTCNAILRRCTTEVTNCDTWIQADSSTVLTLVQQEELDIQREISLLIAVEIWARNQIDTSTEIDNTKLRELINPFLPYIRIKNISAQEFIKFNKDCPCVFNSDEKYEILSSIIEDSSTVYFSTCSVVRGKSVHTAVTVVVDDSNN